MLTNYLPFLHQIIFIFGFSFISSSILIVFFKWFFTKIKILDCPHKYPHEGKRAPIPYWIGIVLFINFLLLNIIFLDLSYNKLIIILVLWAIVSIISFVDDMDTIDKSPFKVPPVLRLFLQIWVGVIVWITSIKIWYISNIFGWIIRLDSYYLQLWSLQIFIIPLIFTIIWYVLVFNSINWSDSIPGLTSWLVWTSLIVILILTIKLYFNDISEATRENSQFVLQLLGIILPSVIILWIFDIQKKFLIWDSWTMFLAFIVATLSIIAGWKIATATTVLGVYIIDAFYVILMRLYNKQNPLKWDTIHHLHFRLGKLGFSKSFIRNLVYSLSFLFWIWAIFLDKIGKTILFLVMIVVVFFVTRILSMKK